MCSERSPMTGLPEAWKQQMRQGRAVVKVFQISTTLGVAQASLVVLVFVVQQCSRYFEAVVTRDDNQNFENSVVDV